MLDTTIEVLLKGLVIILILFAAAAYMTFCERVFMARMQLRLGPNRVGPFGLFQPIADGIKLLSKESFQPMSVDKLTYWLAPGHFALHGSFCFRIDSYRGNHRNLRQINLILIADVNAGILFLLAFSSLAVYGVVFAGWSSNNRYSLLGGLRGTAQIISYEIPMGLSLLTVVLCRRNVESFRNCRSSKSSLVYLDESYRLYHLPYYRFCRNKPRTF